MKPGDPPLCVAEVRRLFPNIAIEVIEPLARIWDEVVHRIVIEFMDLSKVDETELHINVREDMIFELAKLQFFLAESVIRKRTARRDLAAIDPEKEREACLGSSGVDEISSTAKNFYEHVWKKLLTDRWGPRSALAIEREANPPKRKLPINRVVKNHFIPRWFIREHWSHHNEITIWRRNNEGWNARQRNFGKWGFRQRLYGDWLEAYLSLLEGDARTPVQMLLERRPLNQPQQLALIGFFVVQVIRNPFFIEKINIGIEGILSGSEEGRHLTPQQVYESLYQSNEFYDSIARPLLWSRWTLVRSDEPLFVLPDRFCAHGGVRGGFRVIVPLTPHVCFVTLESTEEKKRIIPYNLEGRPDLCARIAAHLIATASEEFVADAMFNSIKMEVVRFSELLREIETVIESSIQRPSFE